MTRILAIDPGTTTGLAVYLTSRDKWQIQQVGPEPHHKYIFDLCVKSDMVICEDFNFRPNPGRRKIVLDSKEYIGVVKLAHEMYGTPYRLQLPSQAKGLFDDKKVKALNLWSPGKPHAMDAVRHLLYYRVVWNKERAILDDLKGKL